MQSERRGIRRTWLALAAAAALCSGGCGRRETPAPEPAPAPPAAEDPDSLRRMRFPTGQDLLAEGANSSAFQPTASGRPESALFGSVRTEQLGKLLAPSFHEGLDIAPLQNDRRGRPLDAVQAVADGSVAYVNRVAGNSSYGKYVVLAHESTLGTLYTLYAHLAEIAPGVQAGRPAGAGEALGVLGYSSSSPIPVARAHLHFEICLLANAHYDRWYRAQKLKPDHGSFNGGNLIGLDPLAVFRAQRADPEFRFAKYMETIPRAFEVVLASPRPLDFFRRYPALWDGAPFSGRALVLAVSENGLPLRGWNAAEADLAELGKKKWLVRRVNTDALGRNGRRLIVSRNGNWILGSAGERWLEILAYP